MFAADFLMMLTSNRSTTDKVASNRVPSALCVTLFTPLAFLHSLKPLACIASPVSASVIGFT